MRALGRLVARSRTRGLIVVAAWLLLADYDILRTARIREETTTRGFVDGIRFAITRTGGVITSAGPIVAGTFAVLMTQPLNSLL